MSRYDDMLLIGYARVSKEDEWGGRESNTIKNQELIFEEYRKKHEDLSRMQYIFLYDDGYSGSNFSRPGIQIAFEYIRQGKKVCIMVKDLSRFGRNYIDVGEYLERLFPILGVRFIAINDSFDSQKFGGNLPEMDVKIKNILNEYVCRELSNNVKRTINAELDAGVHAWGSFPYGFYKKKETGNRLHIDPEAANVVKRVFRLTLEGYGRRDVARVFNQENILTPGEYKKWKKNPELSLKKEKLWTDATVTNILKNEEYIGSAVSGRHIRPVMGRKKVKCVPKEQWKVIKNAHDAIISEEDFQKVQQMLKFGEWYESDKTDVLRGTLSCAVCGYALSKSKKTGKLRYFCDQKAYRPELACGNQKFIAADLENRILEELKLWIANTITEYEKHTLIHSTAYVKYSKEDLFETIVYEKCLRWKKQKKLTHEMLQDFIKRIYVFPDGTIKISYGSIEDMGKTQALLPDMPVPGIRGLEI